VDRYFIHLREGNTLVEDEEGALFKDDVAACNAGLRAARGLLARAVIEGRLPLDDIIIVTDDKRTVLLSLTLGASVGHPTHNRDMIMPHR
jgi:hypothetical protein